MKYIVKKPLKHDGERCELGKAAPKMTKAQQDRLLRLGVIEPEGVAVKTAATGKRSLPTETGKKPEAGEQAEGVEQYVQIEGSCGPAGPQQKWHVVAEDEAANTECGVEIPEGTARVTDEPTGDELCEHCFAEDDGTQLPEGVSGQLIS